MSLKAILFDINGTLVDIETDETRPRLWEGISYFLYYKGLELNPDKLKDIYHRKHNEVYHRSKEKYPEIDKIIVWKEILDEFENKEIYDLKTGSEQANYFVKNIVQMFRALSLKRLTLYNGVYDTLMELKEHYKLGIVSNAQHCWTSPELRMVGLKDKFDSIALSSDYGFCKPDPRLFRTVLKKLGVSPDEAIYVGNDTEADVAGAQNAGMKSILFMTLNGSKDYKYGVPDYTINSFTEILKIVSSL